MLIVGEKDEADETVSVRSRFAGDEGAESVPAFIDAIRKEIDGKIAREVTVQPQEKK